VDIYDNENFFDSEFTAVVKGEVFIDPTNTKKLVFRPAFRLMPNTEYNVYISKTISDTSQEILPAIFSLTFTTHSDDIVEPLVYTPGSVIIGKNVLPEGATSTANTPELILSNPLDGSIMIKSNRIILDFSEAIVVPTETQLRIERFETYADASEIVIAASYVLTLDNQDKRLTITFVEQMSDNYVYKIFLEFISTASGSVFPNTVIEFTTTLFPYYCSTKLLRIKGGSLFANLTDAHLALMINFISQEADVMLTKLQASPLYSYLRQRWVLYSIMSNLLQNSFDPAAADSFKKSFGEYSIAITNGSRVKAFNSLLNETRQWLRGFDHMLNFRYSHGSFVKGANVKSNVESRKWERGVQPGLNMRDPETNLMVWDEIGKPTPWYIAIRGEV
jgi:hypothetical protein